MIEQIKEAFFSFFFPPICPYCKELKQNNQYFCSSCLQLVELSMEKKISQDGNIVEFFCFENIEPMKRFYQQLLKEKHPKKIEIALSFFLIQLQMHEIDIEMVLCLHKKGSLFHQLSKMLSKKLQIPMVGIQVPITNKKILVLEKPPQKMTLLDCQLNILNFLSGEIV